MADGSSLISIDFFSSNEIYPGFSDGAILANDGVAVACHQQLNAVQDSEASVTGMMTNSAFSGCFGLQLIDGYTSGR
jgi:hypothetical protein